MHNMEYKPPVDAPSTSPAAGLPAQRKRLVGLSRFVKAPPALFGVVVLLALTIFAIWPIEWLPRDPYATALGSRLLPPAWVEGADPNHWLGTDPLGRDMLSRMILGARFSLMIVLFAATLSLVVGVTAGLVAGYFRGLVDDVVMRLVDIQLAFPVLVLIIAVVAALGPSIPNLIIVLGIAGWAPYARIVRGVVLSLREREFIEAAHAIGVSDFRIMVRHLLPNSATVIIIYSTFELARLLLLESALSFLGLGVQPPDPSWGSIIADGRQYLVGAWWVSALPGAIIVLAVLAFNLLGDELRDALDPLTQRR